MTRIIRLTVTVVFAAVAAAAMADMINRIWLLAAVPPAALVWAATT